MNRTNAHITHLHNADYSRIGVALREGYLRTTKGKAVSIFLCGGHMGNIKFARPRFFRVAKEYKDLTIRMPEGLFDDLLERKTYDLLGLEEILAHSVDAVVIFPESPGSFAELGAFSGNEALRRKTICICEEEYKADLSFINMGPVKILKNVKSSRVIYFRYKNLSINSEASILAGRIASQARAIKKEGKRNESGIFLLEDLIIYALFCLESASSYEIKKVYSANDIGVPVEKIDMFYDICLNTLLTANRIEKNESNRFQIARGSVREILERSSKERLAMLRSVRIEAMNASLRRHAETKSNRM